MQKKLLKKYMCNILENVQNKIQKIITQNNNSNSKKYINDLFICNFLPSDTAIRIYNKSYIKRLSSCINNTLILSCQLVGIDTWQYYVNQYINISSTKYTDIRFIVNDFANFMQLKYLNLPLTEAILFEIALERIGDSEEQNIFHIDDLFSLTEEELLICKFSLANNMHYCLLKNNIKQIWQHHIKTKLANNAKLKLLEKPEYCLIWRNNSQSISYKNITKQEYKFLEKLSQPQNIIQLAESYINNITNNDNFNIKNLITFIKSQLIQLINLKIIINE